MGTEDCMGRGCQGIFTSSISEACAVTGEERGNTVLPACAGFDCQVWRELCVRLVAGLAILELNHGFNFILYQLEKQNVVKNNVFTNSYLCKMTHLMDAYLYLTLILLLLSKYLILVLLLHQPKEVQPPALCDRVEQIL